MSRVAPALVLAALVLVALVLSGSVPALAQDDGDGRARSFRIERFIFDAGNGGFLIRGKAVSLPDGARLQGRLSLGGELATAIPLVVSEGRIESVIPVGDREVFPGEYRLEVTFRRAGQPREIRADLPDLAEDVDRVAHGVRTAEAERAGGELRDSMIDEVRAYRTLYDTAAQLGAGTIRRIEKALEGETVEDLEAAGRDALFAPWKEFYEASAERTEKDAGDLVASLQKRWFVTPHQSAIQGLQSLTTSVTALRSSYTVLIMRALGMAEEIPRQDLDRGRFSPETLIVQINGVAQQVNQALLPDESIWHPTIEFDEELGRREGGNYISRTSRFRVAVPSDNWKLYTGEENSTMRIALNYLLGENEVWMASVQVHVCEFPWARTKRELAESWVRLAEYEWPNFKLLEGKFGKLADVYEEEGDPTAGPIARGAESGDPRADPAETYSANGQVEVFYLKFRTTTDEGSSVVKCYLHFPRDLSEHRVYGLMDIGLYSGTMRHHLEGEFKELVWSFELVE